MQREAQYYKELGQRIQRARASMGLTQESLASLVGLTRTSMVNIEKGRQKVLSHTLVRLARSLLMRVDDLARDSSEEVKIDELLQHLSEPAKKFVRSATTAAQRNG